jgi:2-oxo-3-hexenedioate decarboxylase
MTSALAGEVLATMAGPGEIEPFTTRYPGFDLGDAYAIVSEVRRRREARGERIVGRKIGFTNAKAWAGYGIAAPIWNYLYDRTTLDLTGDDIFALGQRPNVRMEVEIALGLSAAPAPDMDEDALLGCVEWVALAFEVCSSVFPGWRFKVPDPASTGVHVALLIGPRRTIAGDRAPWRADLASFTAVLSEDGGARAEGGGAQVLGSPLSAFGHLVRELARYGGEPLGPGDVVTTGTLTEALPARAEERWRASVAGVPLEGIEVRLG